MEPAYIYRAEALAVYDGDTFTARVDLGFRASITIQVRVRGVDTPEMRGGTPESRERAHEAQAFTASRLAQGPVLLQSYKDRESFARWVCDVWVGDDKLDELLIAAGHGIYMER